VRRCLHAFLVGLLTLSLSTDAARACWYLRRGAHVPARCVMICPPPAGIVCAPPPAWAEPVSWPAAPACDAPPAWAATAEGCCDEIVVGEVIHGDIVVEEIVAEGAAGEPHVGLEFVTESISAGPAEPSVAAPVEAAVGGIVEPQAEPMGDVESVITPAPNVAAAGPTVAPTAEDVQPPAAPEPTVPVLKPAGAPAFDTEPVRQTTAEEPAGDEEGIAADTAMTDEAAEDDEAVVVDMPVTPAPDVVDEQPAAPAETVEPEEPNLFEEADSVRGLSAGVEPLPEESAAEPAYPAGLPDAAVVDESDETAGMEGEAAVPQADFPDEDPLPADGAEPAVPEPTDEPLPADDPFAAAARPSAEPVRRWIDRTESYAVVGVLVAVHDDGTCVLDAGSRRLIVPIAELSLHDRDYVARAEERLAAMRAAERSASDTAAL